MQENWGFKTKVVHAGNPETGQWGATAVPIYQTAAFDYTTAEELASVFDGRAPGYIYSRIANPTVAAFESRITELEKGTGAVAVASGMAAIALVLFCLAEQDDEVIAARSLFGGTMQLFKRTAGRYGINIRYVDMHDIKELHRTFSGRLWRR